VAARKQKQKQKRMSAQVVEDEDYQLRYEIVAGIDVAKESAVVCVRMPPAAGRKHRTSHLQTVPATVPAITELAAELKAAGVQMVSMEATSVILGRFPGRPPRLVREVLDGRRVCHGRVIRWLYVTVCDSC
jgi:hypothetical protein